MQLFPQGKKEWLRLVTILACMVIFVGSAFFYMTSMPGKSFAGALPPLSTGEVVLAGKLRKTVTYLASNIGERNIIAYPQLQATATFIESWFKSLGYEVKSQEYVVQMRKVSNISVEIPGSTKPEKIIVVGAHYDTVYDCPGADDNTSGIAALLELARLLRESHPACTIRFVAFVNEEPPWFQTESMGSLVYARKPTTNTKTLWPQYHLRQSACILIGPEVNDIQSLLDCYIQIEEILLALSGISPPVAWFGKRSECFDRLEAFPRKVQPLQNSSAAWDGLITGPSGRKIIQPSWSLTPRLSETQTITVPQIRPIHSTMTAWP